MGLGWLSPKVQLGPCGTGQGQFASKAIGSGELIAVFGGHVMTMAQFNALPQALQHYPYQIEENPDLLFGPMRADEIGNGEFFNHCCAPNAGFRGSQHLVAMRDIAAGEQITFDYAMCMTGTFGDMGCQCGAAQCRGFISGEDWKLPPLQTRYEGHFVPYIQRKISQTQ